MRWEIILKHTHTSSYVSASLQSTLFSAQKCNNWCNFSVPCTCIMWCEMILRHTQDFQLCLRIIGVNIVLSAAHVGGVVRLLRWFLGILDIQDLKITSPYHRHPPVLVAENRNNLIVIIFFHFSRWLQNNLCWKPFHKWFSNYLSYLLT